MFLRIHITHLEIILLDTQNLLIFPKHTVSTLNLQRLKSIENRVLMEAATTKPLPLLLWQSWGCWRCQVHASLFCTCGEGTGIGLGELWGVSYPDWGSPLQEPLGAGGRYSGVEREGEKKFYRD